MTIKEKYNLYRSQAKDGDILLWRGTSLLARSIRFFDDHYIDDNGNKIKDPAYYTHSSLVYWGRGERLHNADSWSNGITVVPASYRVDYYKDFCVLRPKVDNHAAIEDGINFALNKWQAHIPYDFFTLPRIALVKKTGIDISHLGSRSKFICSEFTKEFSLRIGVEDYFRRELFTPQDHIRFNNGGLEYLFTEKLD